MGWRLLNRMQRLEECNQRRGFRWTQVFSVGGHVAAALNHLTNQLVFIEAQGDPVERGAAFSALLTERMAVVALLYLEDERAPAFESRPAH